MMVPVEQQLELSSGHHANPSNRRIGPATPPRGYSGAAGQVAAAVQAEVRTLLPQPRPPRRARHMRRVGQERGGGLRNVITDEPGGCLVVQFPSPTPAFCSAS